jgi:hypothetical protein
MQLTKIASEQDIADCVDLYIALNDDSFIPADRKMCIRSLHAHLQSGAYHRCIRIDGVIHAWILARVVVSDFTGLKSMQQVYYASDLVGFKSARAVKCLHQYLMETAEKLKIYQVISAGSHMDPDHVFVRILGKMGWKVRGHIAVGYSSHDPFEMNQN